MGFLGLPFILVFRFSVLIDFWHEADRQTDTEKQTQYHSTTPSPQNVAECVCMCG